MARVIAATERMLLDVGPKGITIPEVAKQASVPRASIYQYFPDKYALLSHLSQSHIGMFFDAVVRTHAYERYDDWRRFLGDLVRNIVAYYNANPVTAVLLLGGPFSGLDRERHFAKDETMAGWLRDQLSRTTLAAAPTEPDALALAVEIGYACMSYGYHREGHIAHDVQEHTIQAVLGYLSTWDRQ